MKHVEYELTGRVENVGRPDGTTRDTWEATVTLRPPMPAVAAGSRGRGTAKAPAVAIRRAVEEAFECRLRAERAGR